MSERNLCGKRKRGIANLGSTCFLSSCLQILFSDSKVVNFLRSVEDSNCTVGLLAQRINGSTENSSLTSDEAQSSQPLPPGPILPPSCIACELASLLREEEGVHSKESNQPPLIPSNLLFAIWCKFPHLASYEQQVMKS